MAVKTFTDNTSLPASDINTYLANAGLVYITQQTIGSAVSSVAVSNCFSSSYDAYRISIVGGTHSTTAYLALQLGSATSNYRYQFIYGNLATTLSTEGQTNASRWNYVSIGGASQMLAEMLVVGPFQAQATMIQTMGGLAGNYLGTLTGVQTDLTSFTGFTIFPSAGTITGGVIRVYGYRQA